MDYKVIIIGTGFSGQIAAINLKRNGITDFVMLERSATPGGTWCQHNYPGAAVDVHSPLYSVSFEPYQWTQMFAEQQELAEYTNHIIDKHGLREKFLLNHNVIGSRWHDDAGVWEVEIENRPSLRARFIINASGLLSKPMVPEFPGKDDFEGESFHTSRWNHSFDYKKKRVAIIGSGASAAQIVPAIAPEVEHLHVFQRSPHWLIPRPDRKFGKFERWLLNKKMPYAFLRWLIFWILEFRVLGFKYSQTVLDLFGKRSALKHLRKQVQDPELRARLTPDFEFGCKRIILSNTYYPAICRENVSLHDKTSGIARITKTGIETTAGEHLDLDLIIYSTGYNATDGLIPYPVIGRDGATLSQFWSDFPRAFLGSTMPGFPNLFLISGPNTGVGHTSLLLSIEAQIAYLIEAIKQSETVDKTVEITAEAEEAYTSKIHADIQGTVWASGCDSWYQNKSGKITAIYPGFTRTFQNRTGNFQTDEHKFS